VPTKKEIEMSFSHEEVHALSDAVLKISGMVKRQEPVSDEWWGTLLDAVMTLRALAPYSRQKRVARRAKPRALDPVTSARWENFVREQGRDGTRH
jgi:hypothetical protein